ncbi:MAG: hypothetical protein HQL72_09100 [Magnetococcales bacterium]|nr:hypothetical protein [Magnetococcales bacterium]
MARSTKKTEPEPQAKPVVEENPLQPVETLAEQSKVPGWELAGVMRAAGWAKGKQATADIFSQALAGFRNRKQGSGRIKVGG